VEEPTYLGDGIHAHCEEGILRLWTPPNTDKTREVVVLRKAALKKLARLLESQEGLKSIFSPARPKSKTKPPHARYGWKNNPDDPELMIEDEKEQETISEILSLRAGGLSMERICGILESYGIQYRLNGRGPPRWTIATISRILARHG